jgi:hypothetical protein
MKNKKPMSTFAVYNKFFACCIESPDIQQIQPYTLDTIPIVHNENNIHKLDNTLIQNLTNITETMSLGDIFSRYQMLYSYLVKRMADKHIFRKYLDDLEYIYFQWDKAKPSDDSVQGILHLLVQYEQMAF